MKFCMVTTFFGAHSFGGDAAYVDRLCRALCRRGHEVHVFHCVDAFELLRGSHPLRPYRPPDGLHVHALRSGWGGISPLATQVTGEPFFKQKALRQVIESPDTDVVHFHNISLVGGPGVLRLGRRAVRLMAAHEHWLICPMHLLWKNDRAACDAPTCVRCTIAGRRPPQAWRYTGSIARHLRELDALVFPSRHAMEEHRRRGIDAPMHHLPYFLPDDWTDAIERDAPATTTPGRPYIAAAGRLVRMKGFQQLIPAMRRLPEVELRIAGTGPFEAELRALAGGLPNVRFVGLLGGDDLSRLFRDARAVVVPSLFPETFGYVVLEAFAVKTPVLVQRAGGAIVETGAESGGGLAYSTEDELVTAVGRILHEPGLRDRLSDAGHAMRAGPWSESAHLERYFGFIEAARSGRPGSNRPSAGPHGPARARGVTGASLNS